MMKKSIIIVFLLIINRCVFGQSIKLGVLGGINESTFVPSNNFDLMPPVKYITGFHFGLFSEIPLGKFSLLPALNYESIGGKNYSYDAHGFGASATSTYRLQYVELPINVVYNIPVSFGKFFFGGGPYGALGLSGKLNFDGQYTDTNFNQVYYNTTTNYKFSNIDKLDFGLNTLTGIKLNNAILITLSYAYGVKSYFYYPYYEGSYYEKIKGAKSNVASLSIGYEFDKLSHH